MYFGKIDSTSCVQRPSDIPTLQNCFNRLIATDCYQQLFQNVPKGTQPEVMVFRDRAQMACVSVTWKESETYQFLCSKQDEGRWDGEFQALVESILWSEESSSESGVGGPSHPEPMTNSTPWSQTAVTVNDAAVQTDLWNGMGGGLDASAIDDFRQRLQEQQQQIDDLQQQVSANRSAFAEELEQLTNEIQRLEQALQKQHAAFAEELRSRYFNLDSDLHAQTIALTHLRNRLEELEREDEDEEEEIENASSQRSVRQEQEQEDDEHTTLSRIESVLEAQSEAGSEGGDAVAAALLNNALSVGRIDRDMQSRIEDNYLMTYVCDGGVEHGTGSIPSVWVEVDESAQQENTGLRLFLTDRTYVKDATTRMVTEAVIQSPVRQQSREVPLRFWKKAEGLASSEKKAVKEKEQATCAQISSQDYRLLQRLQQSSHQILIAENTSTKRSIEQRGELLLKKLESSRNKPTSWLTDRELINYLIAKRILLKRERKVDPLIEGAILHLRERYRQCLQQSVKTPAK